MAKCKALTKAGTPCRAQAGESGTCYLHEDPQRARLLGQSGGRKNRQRLPETPTGPLTAEDLRNIIAQTIRGVQAKTLPPRAASAIAQCAIPRRVCFWTLTSKTGWPGWSSSSQDNTEPMLIGATGRQTKGKSPGKTQTKRKGSRQRRPCRATAGRGSLNFC